MRKRLAQFFLIKGLQPSYIWCIVRVVDNSKIKTLDDLQPGDVVALLSHGKLVARKIVKKTTKTQIVVAGYRRFRKKDGCEVNLRTTSRIEPWTDQHRDCARRLRKRNNLYAQLTGIRQCLSKEWVISETDLDQALALLSKMPPQLGYGDSDS